MASPVDDAPSYLTLAQAAWGLLVFGVGVGAGYTNLKRDVARSKERHDEHDKKFEKLEEKLEGLAKTEHILSIKSDIIREVYALHGLDYDAMPRVVDRRKEPR